MGPTKDLDSLKTRVIKEGCPAFSSQVQAGMDDKAPPAQQVMVQQGLSKKGLNLMKFHKAGIIDTNGVMEV